MLTGEAIAQTTHIGPTDLTALLVQDSVQSFCPLRHNGVRFGRVSHAFGKTTMNAKHHCLHWSSTDPTRAPAIFFPVVGDALQRDGTDELLRVVNDRGTVTYFAPEKGQRCLLGLVKLVQGTDGAYTKKFIQVHESWSFHAQMTSDEEGSFGSDAHAMELFGRKLVMWIFSYYARVSTAQLTLHQLETAFPLLTSVTAQERRRFVGGALTRFAGGRLSFYDDRVIALKSVPVHALSLLSPDEFRIVTSMEQATVAFMFKCQLQHDEVLEALHTILDTWGKRGAALASSLIRLAVTVLLSHAVGTCALLPHGLRGWLRPFVLHYLPTLLTLQGEESFVGKLVTFLRHSKTPKGSTLVAVRRRMEDIMRNEAIAAEPSATCGEREGRAELDEGYFFESVAPLPSVGSKVVWKIAKLTFRHTTVPPPATYALKSVPFNGSAPDSLFSVVLFSSSRLHLSRPFLKSVEDGELCLSLNLGKVASHTELDDEVVWPTARKRRRGRGRV
ncbi:hypothetical protein TraAM80_04549 [Trypanosoma rangeli]|uniref:Uncharacterized protein n=1 Tax=Trypanosoma rangeli TaxID=5698 RepID=A0A422NIY3_TRYRA|nr:uncharacterized protein TraAM80_04549 [Trypanosoma rangeli]RNF05448.1 hypothetical protein TraAM80_04549 [Trypanosoma rangeli]|eukprot:RNF05448.1 hypothetical protein TraAM80_04549 [Trypanosoma rangeli]